MMSDSIEDDDDFMCEDDDDAEYDLVSHPPYSLTCAVHEVMRTGPGAEAEARLYTVGHL